MIQKPKGTYDLMPEETRKYRALENHLIKLLEIYGYGEIRTPIFEYSQVFHRESELSDMVLKETYNFKDKGNRDLTLRPEGTAGVIRSYVEQKLYADGGITKLYYLGPNFRYERPQKGRYRQFYQFGIEAIGAKSPSLDAEVIGLSYKIISSLGLKQVVVKINTLGDIESRLNYNKILRDYFIPHKEDLCENCQTRIDVNPMRILDCKIDGEKPVVKKAPKPMHHLTAEASKYFSDVLKYLDAMDVIYEIDDALVRGLDYYGHTVFEIEANIKGFGAQNILGGGGHYEKLVSEFGGPDVSGVGIAFGMERLMQAIEAENVEMPKDKPFDFYVLYFDEATKLAALTILSELRDLGYKGDIDHLDRKFATQLKSALKNNPNYLIIIGEEELNSNLYTLKNVKTEEQKTVDFDELVKKLGKKR